MTFSSPTNIKQGVRAAKIGLVANAALVLVKLISGIVGHSYALIADAVESTTDLFSSVIVWAGLQISARPPSESHPYGHGKAEPIAAAVVALMLIGAAIGIAVTACREIVTPHHSPAPFTLIVVAGVALVKELLFRRVLRIGDEIGSTAVVSDAWHHRSDAVTSAAAFVGIALALWGGKGWESSDDWAALFASLIIGLNGIRFMRRALSELMDQSPTQETVDAISEAAHSVDGVLALEKLRVRKSGVSYLVDLHVQVDPALSIQAAHIIGGKVKSAIRRQMPTVDEVLVHLEPYETQEMEV